MQIKQLQHFVAVAESLNFSRAAEQVHIAQPALSISIRNLEDELGVKLFVRGTRRVELTKAGRVALAATRKALTRTAEIGPLTRAAAAGEAGVLRMAFVGGATFNLLPKFLPGFRRRFPAVELDLRESTTSQVIEWVQSRTVDVGISRYPLAIANNVAVHVLEHDQLMAVLPKGHALLGKKRLRLADLATESFIQYSASNSASMHAVVNLACQRAGFVPRVEQEAVQLQTMASLVQSGLGIALLPGACCTAFGHDVVFRPLVDHSDHLAVGLALVVDPTNEDPLVAMLLKDFLEIGARQA